MLASTHAAPVSHGQYADGTDRHTDGRAPDRYIMLSAMDAASVINQMQLETADFAPGAATWRTRRNVPCIRVVFDLGLFPPFLKHDVIHKTGST